MYAEATLAERARRANKAIILVSIFVESLLMLFSVCVYG
jgi:hypothetical protein